MPSPKPKKKGAWKFILGPFLGLFGILLLWGLLNALAAGFGFEDAVFMHAFKIIMPVLILIVVMLIPVGIVVGIVRIYDN